MIRFLKSKIGKLGLLKMVLVDLKGSVGVVSVGTFAFVGSGRTVDVVSCVLLTKYLLYTTNPG